MPVLNQQIDVSLMFQTAQIRAVGKPNGRDYLDYREALRPELKGKENLLPVRNVDEIYKNKHLPLKTGGSNSKRCSLPSQKIF